MNKEYRKEYDSFSDYFKNVYFVENPYHSQADWDKNKKDEEQFIIDRFSISQATDYNQDFLPPGITINSPYDFVVKKGSLDKLFKVSLDANRYISNDELFESRVDVSWNDQPPPPPASPFVQVVINCNSKMTHIINEIERIISEKREKGFLRPVNPPYKSDTQLSKYYDLCIEVYKYRALNGLSNVETARKIFDIKKKRGCGRAEYRDMIRPAEDKTNKAYKKAIELVDHLKYIEISF
jgi:hypothetical protein